MQNSIVIFSPVAHRESHCSTSQWAHIRQPVFLPHFSHSTSVMPPGATLNLNELKAQRAAAVKKSEQTKRLREETPSHLNIFTSKSASKLTTNAFMLKNSTRAPAPPPDVPTTSNLPDPSEKPKKAKLTQQLQDFQDNKDQLLDYLFEREHHPQIGDPCECGRGKRLVCCTECLGHVLMCGECFISTHRHTPTHWANVWQEGAGFFARRDISRVLDDTKPPYVIQFGHGGLPCPSAPPNNLKDFDEEFDGPFSASKDHSIFFHIVDHNGIHNTRARFCYCRGRPNRVQQLIQFGLFPATFRRPAVAFTISLLKQFHIHSLESKQSAYDFFGSLRRLTDNMFAVDVSSDLYSEFLGVTRFWRILSATKRLGQAHGIDTLLPHRPAGNLLVTCPACPEVDFNIEKEWRKTPKDFIHINQTQVTLDGNFHANRYKKNSSDNDFSLFEGRSYFPLDSDFKQYLASLPDQDVPEKIECPLKAVKNRNLAMNNLSETGIINCQCPHAVIRSTVDLQKGERFANSDYALARALSQSEPTLREVISYDMSCSYCKNIEPRFKEHFPKLLPVVKRSLFFVPLVHVHNHKENCDYLYSCSYTEGGCRFHGETAESPWPEINQVATQCRQMNNGNRHDCMIDHSGDWNFKKVANMSASLETEIVHSRKLFTLKRDHFISLTEQYSDRARVWNSFDRTLRKLDAEKEVQCVYRHKTGKVPSQKKVYQSLLDKIKSTHERASEKFSNAEAEIQFLNEGIALQRKQRELASRLLPTEFVPKQEAEDRRKTLAKYLRKWKATQKKVMPLAMDSLSLGGSPSYSLDEPEVEKLFLPSDFSPIERSKFDLESLAHQELLLRKGGMFDLIQIIRHTSKTLAVLRDDRKNDRGQCARTRSLKNLETSEKVLLVQIQLYNDCRSALLSLGGEEYGSTFMKMTKEDTYRLPTHERRAIGTSTMTNGKFYHPGLTGGNRVHPLRTLHYSDGEAVSGSATLVQTQGHKAKPRKDKKRGKDKKGTNRGNGITEVDATEQEQPPQPIQNKTDGWIWNLGSMGEMSKKEIQEWLDESDQVQWFRAEAEMQRWQEEHENNQAQFLRCIRAFKKTSANWTQLAQMNSSCPGRVAYALKTAARYARMEQDARTRLSSCGYKHLVDEYTGENAPPLAFLLQKNRVENNIALDKLLSSQPPFTVPTTAN